MRLSPPPPLPRPEQTASYQLTDEAGKKLTEVAHWERLRLLIDFRDEVVELLEMLLADGGYFSVDDEMVRLGHGYSDVPMIRGQLEAQEGRAQRRSDEARRRRDDARDRAAVERTQREERLLKSRQQQQQQQQRTQLQTRLDEAVGIAPFDVVHAAVEQRKKLHRRRDEQQQGGSAAELTDSQISRNRQLVEARDEAHERYLQTKQHILDTSIELEAARVELVRLKGMLKRMESSVQLELAKAKRLQARGRADTTAFALIQAKQAEARAVGGEVVAQQKVIHVLEEKAAALEIQEYDDQDAWHDLKRQLREMGAQQMRAHRTSGTDLDDVTI